MMELVGRKQSETSVFSNSQIKSFHKMFNGVYHSMEFFCPEDDKWIEVWKPLSI